MEVLKLRIIIEDIDSSEIIYLYNKKSLDKLKIKFNEYDNSQFIEINDKLNINGKNCIVKDINFKMYPETFEMESIGGLDMLSEFGQADFNCQIRVLVESLN
jgi:hypothetical protein